MVFVTFNIVLVIYRTCATGRVVQDAYVYCHFQQCFSLLPHVCCSQGIQKTHVLCHFQYSIIYHTFAVGRRIEEAHVLCHFR
jgi:hypothetical protein